jgi:hypothetical protein
VDPLTTGGEEKYVVSAAEVEAKVRRVMTSEDKGAQALSERAGGGQRWRGRRIISPIFLLSSSENGRI